MSSQVYLISDGWIKLAKQQFTTCNNDNEIILQSNTQIREVGLIDVDMKLMYN